MWHALPRAGAFVCTPLLFFSITLVGMLSNASASQATSSVQLANYRDRIQDSLPSSLTIRLPTEERFQALLLSSQDAFVALLPSDRAGFGLGVYSCTEMVPACLVGSFSTLKADLAIAETTLEQHQAAEAPITLAPEIQGYFQDDVEGSSQANLSSVVWIQDEQLYQVTFPSTARQAGLYLASSMAIASPVITEVDTEPTATTPATEVSVSHTEQQSAIFIAQSSATAQSPAIEEPPLLEDLEPVPPSPLDTDTLSEPEEQEPIEGSTLPTIEIRKVEIEGSRLFDEADFLPVFEEVGIQPDLPEGATQRVSLPQLRNIANGITQLYVSQGYITSLATPPEDLSKPLVDGDFVITVTEGYIADIGISRPGEDSEDGEAANFRSALRDSYILSRVQLGLSADSPLRIDLLEEQLRLLQEDSNIAAIEATLVPTNESGLSNLDIEIEEASPIAFGFGIDNYSPPRVGSERMSADLAYRNLTGIGDILSVGYIRTTTGGVSAFDFRYAVPVNPMDGTLQLQIAPERSEITQPRFAAFGLESEVERYGISFRQPIIRSLNEEFALSVGFDYQRGQTFRAGGNPAAFTRGPDEDGVTRTSIFSFGQDYVSRDIRGAWALRSKLYWGTGLFDGVHLSFAMSINTHAI